MKLGSKLQDWLVYSNLTMGLGVAGITFAVSIFLGVFPPVDLLVVMFLIAFASYNINRFAEARNEDMISHPKRAHFFAQNKPLFFISMFCGILALLLAYYFKDLNRVLFLLLAPVGVFVYSIRLFPGKYAKLKEIPILKNIFPSFFWGLIAFFTASWLSKEIDLVVFTAFTFIFIRILIGCIAFDVRDLRGDISYNIKTIPALLGVRKTKYLLFFLNLLSGVFVFAAITFGLLPPAAHVVNLIMLYGFYFTFKLSEFAPTWLYDIIIDGEYFLWGVLAFLGTLIFPF